MLGTDSIISRMAMASIFRRMHLIFLMVSVATGIIPLKLIAKLRWIFLLIQTEVLLYHEALNIVVI